MQTGECYPLQKNLSMSYKKKQKTICGPHVQDKKNHKTAINFVWKGRCNSSLDVLGSQQCSPTGADNALIQA